MTPPLLRSLRILCLLVATCIAASSLGQGIQQVSAVVPANIKLSDVRIIQRIGNKIPLDVPFKDQDDRSVTFGSILDKRPVLMLAIFYRCTGVCSLELANLIETIASMKDQKVGRDFDVIVLGINPKETPDLARAKLKMTLASAPGLKGTDTGWHFLTGTLPNIRKVTNSAGFYYTYDADKDIVNHAAGLMFLTPTGVVSSYILGAQYAKEAVDSDLQTARANQLGIKSPDIFFGCIHIDPLTGKRSIVIQNVLMVFATITVMGMLLMLVVLSGKARFSRRPGQLE